MQVSKDSVILLDYHSGVHVLRITGSLKPILLGSIIEPYF
jgi:hypothetical protein